MSTNTQSKITSIEEQIQKLKEKQKREIAKLERLTGKYFLEKFNLQNESLDKIKETIDSLSTQTESESITNKDLTIDGQQN